MSRPLTHRWIPSHAGDLVIPVPAMRGVSLPSSRRRVADRASDPGPGPQFHRQPRNSELTRSPDKWAVAKREEKRREKAGAFRDCDSQGLGGGL